MHKIINQQITLNLKSLLLITFIVWSGAFYSLFSSPFQPLEDKPPINQRLLIVGDYFAYPKSTRIGGTETVLIKVFQMLTEKGYVCDVMGKETRTGIREDIKHAVAEKINNLKPDHILIALLGPLSYKFACYCADHHIPFTAFIPARIPQLAKKVHGFPQWLSKYYVDKFLARATRILVPSDSLRKEIEAQGFRNVVTWHHGIDLDVFTLPTADEKKQAKLDWNLQARPAPFYLCVTRLSGEKNIEGFLNLHVDGTKILVGPEDAISIKRHGYSYEKLRKKYPDTVIIGGQTGKNLLSLYHLADVFVFPSICDVFGITQLEALACGLPIVGFNTFGPADVVPKGCGVSFLADSFDSRSLKMCAIQAYKASIPPENCRAYAAHFSWDNAMDILENNLVQINELPDLDEEPGRGWLCFRRKAKTA